MAKKQKHKAKERRKRRYEDLIAVGFTSYEANRYKDYSDYKIDLMIEAKTNSNQTIKSIAEAKK